MNFDIILSLLVAVVTLYYLVRKFIPSLPSGDRPLFHVKVPRFGAPPVTRQGPVRPIRRFKTRSKSVERVEPRSSGSTHMNGLNDGLNSSAGSTIEPATATPADPTITLDELQKVARACELLGTGKSQRVAIEEAFSCTKGGGKVWKRGRELLDLARPEATRPEATRSEGGPA